MPSRPSVAGTPKWSQAHLRSLESLRGGRCAGAGQCDERRSPLTDELMHLPGEQAQRKAERLAQVADERMLTAVLIGPMILAVWALQKFDASSFRLGITEAVLLLLVFEKGEKGDGRN